MHTLKEKVVNNHLNMPFYMLEHKYGFCINGYIDHYPVFIEIFKNAMIVVIKTKGDGRDNSDSKRKVDIGLKWTADATSIFRYFKVCKHNSIDLL